MEVETPDTRSTTDRDAFVDAVLEALGPAELGYRQRLFGPLQSLFAAAAPHEVADFSERLSDAGKIWGYEPPHPLGRSLSHIVLHEVLEVGSALLNAQAVSRAGSRSVVLMGNHLSFVDANVVDYLLTAAGLDSIAAQLAVIVGPKVFTGMLRRIATLCFGTVKTPQSTSRASGEAVMTAREVARIASQTMVAAHERIAQGDTLLLFPEGTRSRSGATQRTLSGVARYLEKGDPLLVPFGIVGTDQLVPIDRHEELHRARVVVRLGEPIEARVLIERCRGRRALVMDVVGHAIAACLPEAQRGAYGLDSAFVSARTIAAELGIAVSA